MPAPIKNKKLGKVDGHLTLRLQKYIIDDLDEIAASEGKDRSQIAREVLTYYVNQRRKRRKISDRPLDLSEPPVPRVTRHQLSFDDVH